MSAKKKELESQIINELLEDESAVTKSVLDIENVEAKKLVGDKTKTEAEKSEVDETYVLPEDEIAPKTSRNDQQSFSDKGVLIDFKPKEQTGSLRAAAERMAVKSSTGVQGAAEAQLLQSDNLKVAQEKILDLENELDRLRDENQKLAAAGDTVRQRAEELQTESESKDTKLHSMKENFEQEREILQEAAKVKDDELGQLRMRVQEFEKRLSSNLQRVRVRERELENRLELMKLESSAVTKSKDETLLDLKRQVDQMSVELENYRSKTQELNSHVKDQQDLVRRTIKALRLALSMLEGSEESG